MAKKVPFEIDFFNTEIGNSVYTSGLLYRVYMVGSSKVRIHIENGSISYFSEILQRYVLRLLDMVFQF